MEPDADCAAARAPAAEDESERRLWALAGKESPIAIADSTIILYIITTLS
jgi:hypothetical protein